MSQETYPRYFIWAPEGECSLREHIHTVFLSPNRSQGLSLETSLELAEIREDDIDSILVRPIYWLEVNEAGFQFALDPNTYTQDGRRDLRLAPEVYNNLINRGRRAIKTNHKLGVPKGVLP